LRCKHTETLTKDHMQPDVQLRMLPGEGNCLIACGTGHHQAGGGEDAVAKRADDRGINFVRRAEIIASDNKGPRRLSRPRTRTFRNLRHNAPNLAKR
jgi:hypothetical protein